MQFVINKSLLKVLPQINPFNFGEDQIYLDETVTATCTITKGDLPISIWWTFKSEHQLVERNLTTNDGIIIAKTGNKLSVMNIESVKGRHRGNYTCYARNKAGISVYSDQLAINGDLLL